MLKNVYLKNNENLDNLKKNKRINEIKMSFFFLNLDRLKE